MSEYMDRVRAEKAERVEAVQGAAHDIALALSDLTGESWEYMPLDADDTYGDCWADVGGPGGLRLILNASHHAGKFAIRGKYFEAGEGRGWAYPDAAMPRLEDTGKRWEPCDSIGVSQSKSPERIAADIVRRLLPDYRKAYALCIADRDAYATEQSTRAGQAGLLIDALGGIAKLYSEHKSGHGVTFNSLTELHGGVEVRYDGDVDLKVNYLPLSAALRICAILAECRKGGE